jgi:hypothetical protein
LALRCEIRIEVANRCKSPGAWEAVTSANVELAFLELYHQRLFVSPIYPIPREFVGEQVEGIYVGISTKGIPFYLKDLRFIENGVSAKLYCNLGAQISSLAQLIKELLVPQEFQELKPVQMTNPTRQGDWTFTTKKEDGVRLVLKDIRID